MTIEAEKIEAIKRAMKAGRVSADGGAAEIHTLLVRQLRNMGLHR